MILRARPTTGVRRNNDIEVCEVIGIRKIDSSNSSTVQISDIYAVQNEMVVRDTEDTIGAGTHGMLVTLSHLSGYESLLGSFFSQLIL